MKVTTNQRGRRFIPHSCRFPEEIFTPIYKISQRHKISFNQTLCEVLKDHPRLGLGDNVRF
jgi:hypothetical protein